MTRSEAESSWSREQEFLEKPTNGSELTEYGFRAGYLIDADGEIAHISFRVPDDFNSLIEAELVWLSAGAVTDMVLNVSTKFSAHTEAEDAHSDSTTVTRTTLADKLYEDDISGAFTGLLAGDIVGVKCERPASGNFNGLIIGLRIKYRR